MKRLFGLCNGGIGRDTSVVERINRPRRYLSVCMDQDAHPSPNLVHDVAITEGCAAQIRAVFSIDIQMVRLIEIDRCIRGWEKHICETSSNWYVSPETIESDLQ